MDTTQPRASDRIRLGVPACLLGEAVRYDGGHKRDRFLTDGLGPYVEWVPVCPEVEIGLGIPRDTLRLVGSPAGEDLAARMQRYSDDRVRGLAELELVIICQDGQGPRPYHPAVAAGASGSSRRIDEAPRVRDWLGSRARRAARR